MDVSPYLRRPLRSLPEVRRERESRRAAAEARRRPDASNRDRQVQSGHDAASDPGADSMASSGRSA